MDRKRSGGEEEEEGKLRKRRECEGSGPSSGEKCRRGVGEGMEKQEAARRSKRISKRISNLLRANLQKLTELRSRTA